MPPLPNKEAVGQHPPLWQRRRNWWGWQLRLHRGEEQRRWRTAKRWRSPLMPPLPNKEAVGQHPPLWQRRKNRWGWQLRLHRGEEQSANEGRKEVRKTTENTIFWWRNIASLMTHAFPWKAVDVDNRIHLFNPSLSQARWSIFGKNQPDKFDTSFRLFCQAARLFANCGPESGMTQTVLCHDNFNHCNAKIKWCLRTNCHR